MKRGKKLSFDNDMDEHLFEFTNYKRAKRDDETSINLNTEGNIKKPSENHRRKASQSGNSSRLMTS